MYELMPNIGPETSVEVAIGILRSREGRVLLSQRRIGSHLEGLWEFPGGKVEPGETSFQALIRELHEELGIRVLYATRHLSITHRYPEIMVRLQVYRVEHWEEEAFSREGQVVCWFDPLEINELPTPEASRSIIHSLMLPEYYYITPDPGVSESTSKAIEQISEQMSLGKIQLLQIRAPSLVPKEFRIFSEKLSSVAASNSIDCLINSRGYNAANHSNCGIHLTQQDLYLLQERPNCSGWVAASIHDRDGLFRAMSLPVDFVTLGPVFPTQSHPGEPTLGLQGFGDLCQQSSVPVYALGGLGREDLDRIQEKGGQGVAGIRKFFNE